MAEVLLVIGIVYSYITGHSSVVLAIYCLNTNDDGLIQTWEINRLCCHSTEKHFLSYVQALGCSFLCIPASPYYLPHMMSFLGGAECSTAGNPLSQFTKQVQDDKSLQRDRLVGQRPGGLQASFRSQVNGSSQDNVSCLLTPDHQLLAVNLPKSYIMANL